MPPRPPIRADPRPTGYDKDSLVAKHPSDACNFHVLALCDTLRFCDGLYHVGRFDTPGVETAVIAVRAGEVPRRVLVHRSTRTKRPVRSSGSTSAAREEALASLVIGAGLYASWNTLCPICSVVVVRG